MMTILENQSRDSPAVTAPRSATQANVITLPRRLAKPKQLPGMNNLLILEKNRINLLRRNWKLKL
jgi:hypothetical protein